MEFYLSCRGGGIRGKSWRFDGGIHTLGRDSDCDVVLPDRSVSRVHCRLNADDASVAVTDLGSANGTWINGTRVNSATLEAGDELRLGSATLHFSTSANGSPEVLETSPEEAVSLADTESVLLADDYSPTGIGKRPDTILDLASICSMGRELSRARTRPELLSTLAKRLRRHLNVGAIHLLSPISDNSFDEQILFVSRTGSVLNPLAREQIAICVAAQHDNRRAVAEFHHLNGMPATLLAAPTVLGKQESAVLIVQLGETAKGAVPPILDYLLAIGITVGPLLNAADRAEALSDENKRLASAGIGKVTFIGDSPKLIALRKEIKQVANTPLSVLVTGETGVGKELVAASLHEISDRRSKNFVVVNSPAISPELFASQLFGHRRGAFTGALSDHQGLASLADGGTLFLDEVADLSPENQAALLRFVETRTFFPVGSDRAKTVDVRIIAATNAKLPQRVAEGSFRADLYHRLTAIHISIPPLRERPEDIPALACHFLNQSLRFVKRPITGITDEALQRLAVQPWLGNVRELRNVIEGAAAHSSGEWITEQDVLDRFEHIAEQSGFSFESMIAGAPTLEEIQKRYVAHVFNSCGGNGVKAGKVLGLPKSTVYDRLRKYGILHAREPES